jgi:hypothetical protein
MNEFYSIAKEGTEPQNDFQLQNLGTRTVRAIIGKPVRNSIWGNDNEPRSQTFYRDTTSEDYDGLFACKLIECRPPYKLSEIIDYHFKFYTTQTKGGREKYIMQIRYVVLPMIKKRKNTEVHVELIEEWLDKMAKKKKSPTNIKIGNINAPAQFLVNSDNSNQTLKIAYRENDVKDLLKNLRLDSEKLGGTLPEEFADEIEKTLKQLEGNKNVKGRLLTIGEMIKDVGIGVFTNVISTPAFEALKPFLGLP